MIPEKSPVALAPPHLRQAFEAARKAFVEGGTEEQWEAYCRAIRACIAHHATRRTGAAA